MNTDTPTPTPGDLSEVVRKAEAMIRGTEAEHMAVDAEASLSLGAYLRAALSALPAAGGEMDGAMAVAVGTPCEKHSGENAPSLDWWLQHTNRCTVCDIEARLESTTPQPSAAEGECTNCGRSKRADRAIDACACASLTYTPPPDAVGAQGDGYPNTSDVPDSELREQLSACRDDWQRLCDAVEPGQHFDPDDLIRRLAAPAAGKGVDFDAWHDAKWPEPEQYGHKIVWRQRKADRRAAWQAAITRQPVAGDGMVLVPREPTEAMLEAAAARIKEVTTVIDAGPAKGATLVREPHWNVYTAMLAAAPAATPTDGGEG